MHASGDPKLTSRHVAVTELVKEATAYKTKLRKALRRQQALSNNPIGVSGVMAPQSQHARAGFHTSHPLRTGPSPTAKRGAVAVEIAAYSRATGKTLDGLLAWAAAYGRLQTHRDGVHDGAASARHTGDHSPSRGAPRLHFDCALAEPIIERLSIDDDWADEELDDDLLPQ